MTLESFLAWERAQEMRWEFDGTRPVAMTGGTIAHRRIADDLGRLLNDRLRDRGCEALAGNVKILVAGRVRYPDLVVTCATSDGSLDIVPAPIMVVEIISASTARTDRILKLEEYRRTPSIQHYLLLEQDTAEGVLFTRDGELWRAEVVRAPGQIILAALSVTIPMVDVYGDITAPD